MASSRSDAFVFFGATGDLAHKQIWPALQALVKAGRLNMPVVAVGRKDIGVDAIRDKAKRSLDESETLDAVAWEKLSKQLSYVAVDYDEAKSFEGIKKAVGAATSPLSYVALPPDVFEKVAANLNGAGLARNGRLVLEKPFGEDLKSAKELSKALYAFFPEDSIFRIDHYLGKEQVENIVYFRAANPMFEASWNRDSISCVEITMAETFGVKGRADFYDAVGAIRDVVQNHLLGVVTCIGMELPGKAGPEALRAARTKLLASVRELSSEDLVRGQVRGYREEKGVAANSKTETFAAMKLSIDSPRWNGVPFFVRAGKSLAISATDVIVRWKSVGHPVLDDAVKPPQNSLRLRLSGAGDAISLGLNTKKPGDPMVGEKSQLVLASFGGGGLKPYERLLGDAIEGDPTMYARRDAVEEAWRIVDAGIKSDGMIHPYAEGSWGPEEAASVGPSGGWTNLAR